MPNRHSVPDELSQRNLHQAKGLNLQPLDYKSSAVVTYWVKWAVPFWVMMSVCFGLIVLNKLVFCINCVEHVDIYIVDICVHSDILIFFLYTFIFIMKQSKYMKIYTNGERPVCKFASTLWHIMWQNLICLPCFFAANIPAFINACFYFRYQLFVHIYVWKWQNASVRK